MGMQEVTDALFGGEKYDSVFEVGCGGGYYLLNSGAKKVGGLDVDENDILTCKKRMPRGEFLVHDATKTPWPIQGKSYDIVFSVGTLLLIPNPYTPIKEMLRVAKRCVIIAEYQDDDASDLGSQGDIPQDRYVYSMRISRDYEKVFDTLGVKWEQKPSPNNKTIFKVFT